MPAKTESPPEKKPEETFPAPRDQIVETHKTITIGKKEIRYTVTAGTIVLKEESEKKGEKEGESEGEKAKATVFFVAYTKDGVSDKSKRPVSFSFNGGPGSASVWMHLGLLGPRRVIMGDAGALLPPPYGLADNEHSLLDMTDLVFIDPVSTGFSRAVSGEKQKDFLGFKKDIESVGDFIRLFTTRYQRWLSPKFLVGESYGTTRAAGLSSYLQERHGLYLNGMMLVSAILDFGTVDANPGNDLPYILYLPTYAAIAWYHKKLPLQPKNGLRKFLDEVAAFASGDYAAALMKGSKLPAAERAGIIETLAGYTGLSEDYLDRVDIRIEIMRFIKELLRDRRRTVGRLDGRFTGIDRDSGGETSEFDPSMAAIMGPYSAALNDYVRSELNYESDLPYEILNFRTNMAWSYADHENRYVEVTESLRKAICGNPHLKVFVANGYFDLATPYFATEYTFSHLGLDPSLQANISMGYYEAGHMMYVHEESLARLKTDLAAFIKNALKPD